MNIILEELLQNERQVQISITLEELKEFAHAIIKEYEEQNVANQKSERRLTNEQVRELFGITQTTLWRWRKANFLVPAGYFGRKPYYLQSQIDEMTKIKEP